MWTFTRLSKFIFFFLFVLVVIVLSANLKDFLYNCIAFSLLFDLAVLAVIKFLADYWIVNFHGFG